MGVSVEQPCSRFLEQSKGTDITIKLVSLYNHIISMCAANEYSLSVTRKSKV